MITSVFGLEKDVCQEFSDNSHSRKTSEKFSL